MILRSKTKLTWLGRPMSRFSRIGGLVEHLRERELCLQDRQLVAIAGGAVARWERMW
jgi:hypothetical protein